jgi:F-type H+-transporting ATPase subunit delta
VRSIEIARRYADALYELADEAGTVETVRDAFGELVDKVRAVPDLSRYLTHPMVLRDEKSEFVRRAFPRLPGHLANLVQLVIRNRRETYLDLIYEEFLAAEAKARGITRIRVTTAKELSAEERSRLSDRLRKALGRDVRLEERVDPELLGGTRLELDGTVIDGTLKARLDRLRSLLGG